VAAVFLDLDGFKSINDVHGHKAGDFTLQSVSMRLSGCLRQEDFLARIGGDEFVMLLRASVDDARAEIEAAASRVISYVNLPIPIGGGEVRVGCSLGGAVWPVDAPTLDEAVQLADKALYVSKSRGKNTLTLSGDDAEGEALLTD